MPQPALKFVNNVQETCPVPAPPGTGPLLLQGRVPPYRPFVSQCADGQAVEYSVTDGTFWENGWGTFRTGPNRIERDGGVYESSNGDGLVDWVAGATLTVMSALVGTMAERLFGAVQSPGLIVRLDEHNYFQRMLVVTAPFLKLSNANGHDGNPQIDQEWSPLRRQGGGDGDRTMTDYLILAHASTRFTQSVFQFEGSGGVTDTALIFNKGTGPRDYRMRQGIGNVLYDVLTDKNTLVSVFPATSDASGDDALGTDPTNFNALRDDLTVSVPVPATGGPFHISVSAIVGAAVAASGSPGTGELKVQLYQKVGAGGFAETYAVGRLYGAYATVPSGDGGQIVLQYDLDAPLANTTYQYRPIVTAGQSGGGSYGLELPSGAAGTQGLHTIRATLYTRSN